jgi:hypothetical protein
MKAFLLTGRQGSRWSRALAHPNHGQANQVLLRENLGYTEAAASSLALRPLAWSAASPATATVRREEPGAKKSEEDKYKEAAGKFGEAFLATDQGKQVLEMIKNDPLVKGLGKAAESAVSTLPGKIITGTLAVGAVSGIAAAFAASHTELPAQIPEIPLDVLVPGLSVQLTYKGPVDKPTEASLTIKYTEQKSGDKKPGPTASEKFRAETAKIALDQAKFRASLRYPPGSKEDLEQKAEQAAFDRALAARLGLPAKPDGLPALSPGLPGLPAPTTPQLTMPEPSYGYKPPTSYFGDQFKFKQPEPLKVNLPDDKKKEDDPTVQRKLAIGGSNDPLEHEADQVADQVVGMSEPSRVLATSPVRLQSKHTPAGDSGQAAAPHSVREVLASPGRPLDAATRGYMEPRFGHDFSGVRIHSDARAGESARQINAAAYAVGRDVVFAPGSFQPGSAEGRRLLAHELAHVVQQSDAAPAAGKAEDGE